MLREAGIPEPVVEFDFTKGAGAAGWVPNPRVAGLKAVPGGIEFESTGEDPWLTSPLRDYPVDRRIQWTIRMRSWADSGAQLFFGPHQRFDPKRTVRFRVIPDGEWREYRFVSESLGPAHAVRLDPCGGTGRIQVASIRAEALLPPMDSFRRGLVIFRQPLTCCPTVRS